MSDEENDNCGGTPPFQINKQDKTVFGKTSFGIGDTDTHFPVPLHSIKREKFCTPLKCGDRKNIPIFGHRHQTVRNTFLQAPCETARGNGSRQQVPQVIDISTSPVLKNIVEHQQVSDGVTQSPEKETRSEISESVQSLKNDSEAKKKYSFKSLNKQNGNKVTSQNGKSADHVVPGPKSPKKKSGEHVSSPPRSPKRKSEPNIFPSSKSPNRKSGEDVSSPPKSPKKVGEGKTKGKNGEKENKKMAFEFDADGLPIWEEKVVPQESVPPRPSGWDQKNWEAHLNKTYHDMRTRHFKALLASCKHKLERDKVEKEKLRKWEEERREIEAEKRRKEEAEKKERERKEREEREQIERERQEQIQHEKRERTKEMEKEAEQKLLLMAFNDLASCGITISDDDGEGGGEGEEADDERTLPGDFEHNDEGSEENRGKTDYLKTPPKKRGTDKGFVPILKLDKVDRVDLEMKNRQPLGGDAFDSGSQYSDDSNFSSRCYTQAVLKNIN